MDVINLSYGRGRTKVMCSAYYLGEGIVASIYNINAHIGAVAVAEFDKQSRRTSVSVITRSGHKDDVIAQDSAHSISKQMKTSSCVIAGIHLDEITPQEMTRIIRNSKILTCDLLQILQNKSNNSEVNIVS